MNQSLKIESASINDIVFTGKFGEKSGLFEQAQLICLRQFDEFVCFYTIRTFKNDKVDSLIHFSQLEMLY